MKIAVIIPCFNEEMSIKSLVSVFERDTKMLEDQYVPIVVNDCSKDNTKIIASTLDCVLLDLPVNLGIGGAVQTGFLYALEHDFDLVIQMDGDGQHPPSELYKLVNEFRRSNCDIVIGSRFLTKEGFQSSTYRRIGISYFVKLIKILIGLHITDPTSGFRAFGRKAIKEVCAYYPEKYPEPEILVYLFDHNLKITEVPVIMNERESGVSSIGSWKSAYYMIKVSLGILFTHFRYKMYGKNESS